MSLSYLHEQQYFTLDYGGPRFAAVDRGFIPDSEIKFLTLYRWIPYVCPMNNIPNFM